MCTTRNILLCNQLTLPQLAYTIEEPLLLTHSLPLLLSLIAQHIDSIEGIWDFLFLHIIKELLLWIKSQCTKMYKLKYFPDYHSDSKWNASNFRSETSINSLIKVLKQMHAWLLIGQSMQSLCNNICYCLGQHFQGRNSIHKLRKRTALLSKIGQTIP